MKMLKLFNTSREQLKQIVESPFSMEYIEGITIRAFKSSFSKEINYYGLVDFKRGDVSAQQRINGDSLVDVFVKVHDFCERLK